MTGKQINTKFSGTWYICEMEQWDADYFNMEVQAYIEIDKDTIEGRIKFHMGEVSTFVAKQSK